MADSSCWAGSGWAARGTKRKRGQARRPTQPRPTPCRLLAIEAVPQAADIADVARVGGIVAEFAAQAGDVVIDDACAGESVGTPGAFDELFAAEDPAAGTDKHAQQLEFDGGQLDHLAAAAQFAAR